MSEPAYMVGYSRPPKHTQFKKGQSGNPGGKPGPKKRIKRDFEASLGEALKGDRWELKDARPTKVIDALARKVTLDALDGKGSALRLVLAILDQKEDGAAGEESRGEIQPAVIEKREDEDGNQEIGEKDAEKGTEESPFVFDDEDARQALGKRYDEFKTRFEKAMNEGNIDDLADLAEDFGAINFAPRRTQEFPQSGNS